MNLRKFFLTLGYSGLFPKAPGTVGSLVALGLGILVLQYFGPETLLLASLLITVVAVKEINIYEKEVGEHDGKEIVIDELAGMWIALAIAVDIEGITLPVAAALSFVFFRIFDIYKPSIIGRIDKNVKGGWGVMGDDVVAGFVAGIATTLTYHLILMAV